MFIEEIIKELKNRKYSGDLRKTRFACAQCGNTWVEIKGFLIAYKESCEDICFHIGMESENCQLCRHRPIDCPVCDSKDIYEIDFLEKMPEETSFIFKNIKKITVERTTH